MLSNQMMINSVTLLQCYILALHMKYFFKMQVFHLRGKPDGVSMGIKIHPPDLNGRHLLAIDFMNN